MALQLPKTQLNVSVSIEHGYTDLDRMIATVDRLVEQAEPYSQEQADLEGVACILDDIYCEYEEPPFDQYLKKHPLPK